MILCFIHFVCFGVAAPYILIVHNINNICLMCIEYKQHHLYHYHFHFHLDY